MSQRGYLRLTQSNLTSIANNDDINDYEDDEFYDINLSKEVGNHLIKPIANIVYGYIRKLYIFVTSSFAFTSTFMVRVNYFDTIKILKQKIQKKCTTTQSLYTYRKNLDNYDHLTVLQCNIHDLSQCWCY
jgi:hypothetical protein